MSARQSGRTKLLKLIDDTSSPIYVLDRQQAIVYVNEACCRWLGTTAAKLIGQHVRFAPLEAPSERLPPLNGLCPPPTANDSRPSSFCVSIIDVTQQIESRCAMMLEIVGTKAGSTLRLILVGESNASTPAANDSMAPFSSAESPSADRHRQLRELVWQLRGSESSARLLGTSAAMQRVWRQIDLAAAQPVTTTIVGPRGSDMEGAAKRIHTLRGGDPLGFVSLTCQFMDGDLLSTIIPGLLRRTERQPASPPTTVVLDEFTQLPPDAWVALEPLWRHVGDRLHLIVTSSQPFTLPADLPKAWRYELTTLVIELPPLSERLEDIPWLVQAAIEECNATGTTQREGATAEAIQALLSHRWREDVAELWSFVQAAHASCGGPWIGVQDWPDVVRLSADADRYPREVVETIQLDDFLAEIEQELIERALAVAKGNRAQAARLLGVSRNRLLRRLGTASGEERADDVS